MINLTYKQVKAIAIFINKIEAIETEIKERGFEESNNCALKMLTLKNNISGYELDVEINIFNKKKT